MMQDQAIETEVTTPANPWVEILAPGPMTTIQDMGRFGYARHGVSRAGAADGFLWQ